MICNRQTFNAVRSIFVPAAFYQYNTRNWMYEELRNWENFVMYNGQRRRIKSVFLSEPGFFSAAFNIRNAKASISTLLEANEQKYDLESTVLQNPLSFAYGEEICGFRGKSVLYSWSWSHYCYSSALKLLDRVGVFLTGRVMIFITDPPWFALLNAPKK